MAIFTLGVWRQLRFGRELYYVNSGGGPAENHVVVDASPIDRLYEQIFSWSPVEDVWGGIHESEVREDLRLRFLSAFRYDVDPTERGIPAMVDFVGHLRTVAMRSDCTAIIDGRTIMGDGPTAGTNIRFVPTLAFLNHLQWIVESFMEVPNVSIMVR